MNTVKFMVFMGASGMLLVILYNTDLFYMGLSEGKTWIIVLLSTTCFVAGLIFTCLVGELIKEYLIQLVGAAIASFVLGLFVYPIPMHVAYKVALTVVAGLLGFFFF